MKFTKKLMASAVAVATVSAASFAPVANAEIAASAGVASTYLWRGMDLGSGTPAVFGDLTYSEAGFYVGAWASSGDTSSGTEYDLYVGYGGEVGAFSYDVSIWNYIYPNGGSQEDGFGDLSEIILSVGLGPVSVSWYENIATPEGSATDESYRYYTLGYDFSSFNLTIGHHDDEVGTSLTHVDASYAYNDNLTFTLSQLIKDQNDAVDDDLKFVVSYSLPIE